MAQGMTYPMKDYIREASVTVTSSTSSPVNQLLDQICQALDGMSISLESLENKLHMALTPISPNSMTKSVDTGITKDQSPLLNRLDIIKDLILIKDMQIKFYIDRIDL